MLCARLYAAEVDGALYRALIGRDLNALLEGTDLEWMEPERVQRGEAVALDELAEEYCRLFVGPVAECPPYASVQRGEALLGGRSRALFEELLARQALDARPEEARLGSPDHLAVMLSALASLLEDDRIAQHGESAARALLRMHLVPWMPEYARDSSARARCALYRTLATLTLAIAQSS